MPVVNHNGRKEASPWLYATEEWVWHSILPAMLEMIRVQRTGTLKKA
jgi:hypothetical protein